MLRKLFVLLGILTILFGLFYGPEAYAADFGPASWRTEDGKYELTVVVKSNKKHVVIGMWDLYRVNYKSGVATPMNDDSSPLRIRLCSASTGNCTSYKKFNYCYTCGYHTTYFVNMIPGKYYVDIRDSWRSHYFKGKIEASTFR